MKQYTARCQHNWNTIWRLCHKGRCCRILRRSIRRYGRGGSWRKCHLQNIRLTWVSIEPVGSSFTNSTMREARELFDHWFKTYQKDGSEMACQILFRILGEGGSSPIIKHVAMEQPDSRRIHNTLLIYLPILRVRHKRRRCTNGQREIRNWGQSWWIDESVWYAG